VLAPRCGEEQIVLPQVVIEFQILEYPDLNLITICTELSSILMLEIGRILQIFMDSSIVVFYQNL
jgi:hypothetical protein